MSDVLLQYAFKVTAISTPPQASISMLRNVLLVVKPKMGIPKEVVQVTNTTELAALTANTDGVQLLAGGLTKFYVLPTADMDISEQVNATLSDYYTIIVSSDFASSEISQGSISGAYASIKIEDITYTAVDKGVNGNAITIDYVAGATGDVANVSVIGQAITVEIESGVTTAQTIASAIALDTDANALVTSVVDFGDEADVQMLTGAPINLVGGVDANGADYGLFDGVTAYASSNTSFLVNWLGDKRIGFYTNGNGAMNLCYAFGRLLSQSNWKNQQYLTLPFSDEITELGQADALFEDRISFAITSEQYNNRLAFFGNERAIVAPYVLKEIEILTQSRAVQYIAVNQPNYTIKESVLLENALNLVLLPFIEQDVITFGATTIRLEADNFVAQGEIRLSEPRALWRVFSTLIAE